ncbi:MAG: hypothetical protein JKY03_10845 [Aureispira sp.]|nr:hypothetical protein [Aureispira sp.]
MKRETKVLLIVAIFMQICSCFLPFMRNINGYQFFGEGIEALFNQGINTHNWYTFYAFFAPILSFPILLIGLFKPFSSLIMKVLKVGLFIFLLCPVLLSVVLIGLDFSIFIFTMVGYLFWVVSFCLMYGLFFFRK